MTESVRRIVTVIAAACLSLGVRTVHAQELVLRGRVVLDESSSPVAGVVVSVRADGDENVLAYAMTDDGGRFSLTIPGDGKDLLLTASSMMTETVSMPVPTGEEEIRISVKEKKMTIREAKVYAPKVRMQGDTLNYNVSGYLKADDRSIGEVLRRLPGIKVTSDGEIFYQNLPINKFYVEGLDLLQGRYGLAMKNIDPAQVATVQILENHQPIRVLEGMEVPPQAAINLKLKRSALGAFFLTAQAGLGLSPLLYSNELLGMRFTRNRQSLLLYKNDNTGRDIASEMTSFYGTSSSPLLTVFSPEVLTPPAIDRQHYLFNDAHLVSLNDLRLLKKGFTLTGNAHFLTDRQQKNGFYRQTIHDPESGDLVVAEDISSGLLKRELSGTVTLEKNDKDCYLTNRTDANIAWNQQDCSVASDSPLSQKAKLPSFAIENKFAYKTAKDRWSSHFLYSCQDNALAVSPVMLPDLASLNGSAVQQVKYGQLEADVGYYRSVRLARYLYLDINLRPFLKDRHFVSGFLSGEDRIKVMADSLTNELARTELGTDIEGCVSFRKRSLTARLSAAGQYLYLARNNHISAEKTGRHLFLLSPRGYVEYTKRNLTYRLDASWQQNVSDIRNDLSGYLMSSYRSFSRADGTLSRSGRFSTDMTIHYKDIGNTFFSLLMAGYSLTRRNTLRSLSYDGVLCRTTETAFDNLSDNWWIGLELGKDIRVLSGTVKLDSRFSRSRSETLYQGRVVDCSMDAMEIVPSWYMLLGTAASLSYEANYHVGRSIIDGRKSRFLHDLRQSAEISVSPFKNMSVKIAADHFYNSGLASDPSRWFVKTGLSYKYKKTEWMLDWSNIFNAKEMVTYYYDDISSYCSRYKLRPAEILLRVKINIL